MRSSGSRSVLQVMADQDELILRMRTIAGVDESPAGDNDTSPAAVTRHIVLVSGLTDRIDENTLRRHIQDKRRVGGGVVSKIDFRRDRGEAVVTYSSQTGREVLQCNIRDRQIR